MPKIEVEGKVIECGKGENLRKVLIKNQVSPHNGSAEWLNCRGLGTCGTCAIQTDDKYDILSTKEKIRLSAPPFCNQSKWRLSCQVKVDKDLKIKKGKGFWGEKINDL